MAKETTPFRFKQFDVDQSGCAMKINTDGVLLGALAQANDPKCILDIGTGTGVIALMLAQRFPRALIDAVEIDLSAAATTKRNFSSSPFVDRVNLYPTGFEQFFELNLDKKYDLIVSNPPFYINSLKSPKAGKQLAKHADRDFFEKLLATSTDHLMPTGILCMILPVDTAELVMRVAAQYGLFCINSIDIRSFSDSEPHRVMLCLSLKEESITALAFTIFKTTGVYSEEYINLLKPYFIAF